MKRHRTFWRWLELLARAEVIKDFRRKRIMRENLETWNRENRKFIEKENRREFARSTKGPSADESSTVGHYGCDSGNGGGLGF